MIAYYYYNVKHYTEINNLCVWIQCELGKHTSNVNIKYTHYIVYRPKGKKANNFISIIMVGTYRTLNIERSEQQNGWGCTNVDVVLTLEICGYRYYVCHWGDERRQQNKYVVDLCRLCVTLFDVYVRDTAGISVLSRKSL